MGIIYVNISCELPLPPTFQLAIGEDCQHYACLTMKFWHREIEVQVYRIHGLQSSTGKHMTKI